MRSLRAGPVEPLDGPPTQLGESPRWDPRTGVLLWVDMPGGTILSYEVATGITRTTTVLSPLGCVLLTEDPAVALVTTLDGFAAVGLEDGALRPLVTVGQMPAGARLNDGLCDPAGRVLAGTMAEGATAPVQLLLRWDPGVGIDILRDGVRFSNGLAFSPDFRTLYHADTAARRVTASSYDMATGAVGEPRTAIRTPWPDGLTTDADGRLWIADWYGSTVTVWDPVSGERLEQIAFPADHVTSCVFGGPDLTDLYVTSARGGLFRVATTTSGRPAPTARLEPGSPRR